MKQCYSFDFPQHIQKIDVCLLSDCFVEAIFTDSDVRSDTIDSKIIVSTPSWVCRIRYAWLQFYNESIPSALHNPGANFTNNFSQLNSNSIKVSFWANYDLRQDFSHDIKAMLSCHGHQIKVIPRSGMRVVRIFRSIWATSKISLAKWTQWVML